jgi:hypothetical protein
LPDDVWVVNLKLEDGSVDTGFLRPSIVKEIGLPWVKLERTNPSETSIVLIAAVHLKVDSRPVDARCL